MAKKAEELECWQLADKLRAEVIAICEQPRAAKHLRFCDGFTDAAGSVCRNIEEGFGRYYSAQIVQFFGYALASLNEIQDYLHECTLRKFIDQPQLDELNDLAEHCRAKSLNFMRYHEAKLPPDRPKQAGKPRRRPKGH